MLLPHVAHILLISIVVLSLGLMLVRPRNIPEVWWVGGGAVLLVALRLLPLRDAGRAVAEGSDVYLFLTGMMLLSELAQSHGVFDWVASQAVHHAKGSCVRLFGLVYAVGTLVTITLSNDATAVVLTPAVLAAAGKAKVEKPLPYLFACAMIANAASFVLPISNPANLVVFRQGMPPLGSWLAAFLLPSVASIAATYAVLRWRFRSELAGDLEQGQPPEALTPGGRWVLAGLGLVIAVLLTASGLGRDLGLPTCVAAVAIAGVLSVRERRNPWPLVRGVSWSTLLLVAGLFVLVRAAENAGLLHWTQAALGWVARSLPQAAGVLLAGGVVAVANNLVNNLPLGLVASATLQSAHPGKLLGHAVLIAVDLGPNLSVTGSLATILWLLALRRGGQQVSAWDFLKAGALAMPAALVAALGVLLAVSKL